MFMILVIFIGRPTRHISDNVDISFLEIGFPNMFFLNQL